MGRGAVAGHCGIQRPALGPPFCSGEGLRLGEEGAILRVRGGTLLGVLWDIATQGGAFRACALVHFQVYCGI